MCQSADEIIWLVPQSYVSTITLAFFLTCRLCRSPLPFSDSVSTGLNTQTLYWTWFGTNLIVAASGELMKFFYWKHLTHSVFWLNCQWRLEKCTNPFLPHLSSSKIDINLVRLSLETFSRFRNNIGVSTILQLGLSCDHHVIQWIFTTGLALSSIVDILITGCLFMLLQSSRTGGMK